jgi:hypothetical protein
VKNTSNYFKVLSESLLFGSFEQNVEVCQVVESLSICRFLPRPLHKGRTISGGVQAALLSKLRQGLGVKVKDFHTK